MMSQQPNMNDNYGLCLEKGVRNLYEELNKYTGQFYSRRYYELLENRKKLPVWNYRNQFMECLRNNKINLIVGETGSGKSTQIPQWCLEYCDSVSNGSKAVVCTQPRRITAVRIAEMVSQEMDVNLGSEVGYSIRFDDCTSAKTVLTYMTDGKLLGETINGSQFESYGVVMLDEVHERTADADILMALLKQLVAKRNDLKVVIMSATLDTEKFKLYFNDAPLMKIPGRNYDIEIVYETKDNSDYVNTAINKVIDIHTHEKSGDILLFLTGQGEIEDACDRIDERMNRLRSISPDVGELLCIPLYSLLPGEMQQLAFETLTEDDVSTETIRKVIVSTNVAETSLTIDGIVFVVDCGYSKQKRYNAVNKLESLNVLSINQASAVQRAGRAGRTKPGKCYRMYTEERFKKQMQVVTCPEILRTNLASVLLKVKKISLQHLDNLQFIDPPDSSAFLKAQEILTVIGALNRNGLLTPSGALMVEFPIDPQLAKMLLASIDYNCQQEVMSITAMLSVSDCFTRPKKKAKEAESCKEKFDNSEGDHFALLKVYNEFVLCGMDDRWCSDHYLNYNSLKDAYRVRRQLVSLMEKLKLNTESKETGLEPKKVRIRKAILSGFHMQVAARTNSMKYAYRTKDDQIVRIHPSSGLFKIIPQYVVYNECLFTKQKYIKTVTKIEIEWFREITSK